MPGVASATGLLEAPIRPVYRPKPKKVDLSGSTKPVSFVLRPFSGFFNPYPYSCSILCNHPVDSEAGKVIRRAKDSWTTEGKVLLLADEQEMIRGNLPNTVSSTNTSGNAKTEIKPDEIIVPEELFRKYTETDSRLPTPTFAGGGVLTNRPNQDKFSMNSNLRERTTLVLDLRANSQEQKDTTFDWHALSLESPPVKKTEICITKPKVSRYNLHSSNHQVKSNTFFTTNTYKSHSSVNIEEDQAERVNEDQQPTMVRTRRKRLCKGKRRRGSVHGQQTEVHDLFESTETQISYIGDGFKRTLTPIANDDTENLSTSPEKVSMVNGSSTMLPSFLEPDILKHLCRQSDSNKVEAEYSTRRKMAFEEALRVRGESCVNSRRFQTYTNPVLANTPKVFSRHAARFEILHSESLRGLSVLEYLSKHVFVTLGRTLIFGRVFDKFRSDTTQSVNKILPSNIPDALQEVVGERITEEKETYLKSLFGDIKEPLNFRSWCGLCAAVERLLCPLPHKEVDPPNWLEITDFETLERRLKSVDVDPKLAMFLREIREK